MPAFTVSEIPEGQSLSDLIENPSSITQLKLVDLSLTPKDLGCLSACTETRVLNLKGNALKHVPKPVIREMKSLGALVLANCGLKRLNNVESAKSLNSLVASHNEIETVQEATLKPLTNLSKLNLSFNKLTAIPPVFHLNRLRELRLSHNAITAVPETITQLSDLRILALSHNAIASFDDVAHVGKLRLLVNLSLVGNPLCGDDAEAYREKTLKLFPRLQILDDRRVAERKRYAAGDVAAREHRREAALAEELTSGAHGASRRRSEDVKAHEKRVADRTARNTKVVNQRQEVKRAARKALKEEIKALNEKWALYKAGKGPKPETDRVEPTFVKRERVRQEKFEEHLRSRGLEPRAGDSRPPNAFDVAARRAPKAPAAPVRKSEETEVAAPAPRQTSGDAAALLMGGW